MTSQHPAVTKASHTTAAGICTGMTDDFSENSGGFTDGTARPSSLHPNTFPMAINPTGQLGERFANVLFLPSNKSVVSSARAPRPAAGLPAMAAGGPRLLLQRRPAPRRLPQPFREFNRKPFTFRARTDSCRQGTLWLPGRAPPPPRLKGGTLKAVSGCGSYGVGGRAWGERGPAAAVSLASSRSARLRRPCLPGVRREARAQILPPQPGRVAERTCESTRLVV